MDPVRVLIVDDSALVRRLLTGILDASPDIEVVGTAMDPYVARRKIKELNPDVITLDVEMPRMDGLTFLEKIMTLRPMPVLMISSLTEKAARVAMRALELGAVDYVTKPKNDLAHSLQEYSEEIVHKVLNAAQAKLSVLSGNRRTGEGKAVAAVKSRGGSGHFKTTDKIIAIGASTGGTVAIAEILRRLPATTAGVVVTQHIPETFSGPFAERVNQLSAMEVTEAEDGVQILPGHAYIAPGSHHLRVERDGARYICRLDNSSPVNRHRPSVDVLFQSVAANVGPNAIGVILTGMGKDGAQGIKEMKQAGASTMAQDEATSVIWGMPGEAVRIGGVDSVEPLDGIPQKIADYAV